MKMEVSAEQLGTLRASFPLLETKYSTAFVVFKLTNQQEEHEVVWVRGSVDGVYQAKMAMMVIISHFPNACGFFNSLDLLPLRNCFP